ncbi:hypothetical protein NHQ30_006576 [Ciborinia camelliae]|nr:hypothetical protein NHQ30_006576 [Ciborinia camelliae]
MTFSQDLKGTPSNPQFPSFKNSSLSSSSSSSSKDSMGYLEFKYLSPSSSFRVNNGTKMLVVESIVVIVTACILYILSSRWKSHTHRVQHGGPKKASSSSPTTTTRSILHNPLTHISRLLSCSSSTLTLPAKSASASPSPSTPQPQPQAHPEPQKPPYVLPPLKPTSPHPTSMGLKRLDKSNWLTIDSSYLPEHSLRASLLKTHLPCVLQVLPPAIPATHELLDLVIEFLLQRYPEDFTLLSPNSSPNSNSQPHAEEKKILNKLTGESYVIGPTCENPLEIAARLCMEDFNILLQDPSEEEGGDAEWKLQASATLFPAGWKLQERIGCSMAVLHAPVPGWKANLGKSVNSCMERSNLFIQTTPILFQDAPERARSALRASEIYVRRERQTFTRLATSGAVLFTVRTYMERLVDLEAAELEALRRQIAGWEAETARYPEDFTLLSPNSSPNSNSQPHAEEKKILNKLTGESYVIGPTCENPLEIAARLCMEDFNILLQDPSEEEGGDAEWKLQASATLFPAGWKLQERIGCSMAVLHAPVPGWKANLGKSVNSCMERSNLFIQTTPILFQDAPERARSALRASEIYVRRERQTFTRLATSGAVLFTVRTYMERLVDLEAAELEALRRQIAGWEAETARYKGIANWGGVLVGWCEGVEGRGREKEKEKEKEKERLRGLRRDSGIDMGESCEEN